MGEDKDSLRDIFMLFTSVVTEDSARDSFTDEQFYKNFVLGSELDICMEYMKYAFSSFKKFILKDNSNVNAFNFFYQIHTSLERAMKIVLLLSSQNYKNEDLRRYNHNLKKLCDDTKTICVFNDSDVNFINSLNGKYLELRYKNFDSLKEDKKRLSAKFHKNELIKWVNKSLSVKIASAPPFMWTYSGRTPIKTELNKIVRDLKKIILEICSKIMNYIKIKAKELNIFLDEMTSHFYRLR